MADKPVRAPLSVKEHKQLLKASELLDDKKFKACLKLVDELVKERKPAEVHGSVIALKGLCMVKSSQDEAVRNEGLALCKQGVTMNIESPTAWRYFALAQLVMKLYPLAAKSLAQVINRTVDDPFVKFQSQRELCQVHAMNQNWAVLVKLRLDMAAEPRYVAQRWTSQESIQLGVCVAHHLAGQTQQAIDALDAYRARTPGLLPLYQTELLMYRAQLLRECKGAAAALAFLDASAGEILDVLGLQESRAQLLLDTGAFDAAEVEYRDLLRRNPENYTYHAGLQQAVVRAAVSLAPGQRLAVTSASP